MDLLQREGQYPVPASAPSTLGVEFSGTIDSLGSDAEGSFKTGDEVFGLAYGGAYAEFIVVSTHMLIHKPAELSWEECAGIPETWITATQALYMVGGFREGMSVLWHAGASSVSIAGIQLSKADGARDVYVTASTKEKIEFCKGIGATEGFNYKEGDWAEKLLEYTGGKGVDLIVDFVGASYFNQNLDAAAVDGHIVNLGFLGGATVEGKTDISRFLRKRLRFEGSSLRSRDEAYQGKLRDLLVEHSLPKFVDGTFKVFVEKVFKMEDIQEAHLLMESNQTMGKLICTVD
jgi:NADPH2:quinone reductase